MVKRDWQWLRERVVARLRVEQQAAPLAREFNIPSRMVRAWAGEEGIHLYRGTKSRFTGQDKDRALALLRAGAKAVQVAEEFGVSTTTISRWATRGGIKLAMGSHGGDQALSDKARTRALQLLGEGYPVRHIANEVGYSFQWVRDLHDKFFGMDVLRAGSKGGALSPARAGAPLSVVGSGRAGRGRRITHSERVQIATGLAHGKSARQIALELARHPSTISREINRGAVEGVYDAWVAEHHATCGRARPKIRKIAANPDLRGEVVELLVAGCSPIQIAARLKRRHPHQVQRRLCAESLYQAIYQAPDLIEQARHAWQQASKDELGPLQVLRSGRSHRRPHNTRVPNKQGFKSWIQGKEISNRGSSP